jgi:hypothetical protein
MPPPVPTPRTAPIGKKLDDGYRTLITFATVPGLALWEKTAKPPGLAGGEAVDTTTFWNAVFRTKAPRALKDGTACTFTAAYDPALTVSLLNLINVKTTITVGFPNNGALAFFGYLQSFEPGDLAEGTQPEATCTIMPTNQDPVDGTEQGWVYQAPTLLEAPAPHEAPGEVPRRGRAAPAAA